MTLLSNHPGWFRTAGRAVPPDDIAAMIDALDANGWLHRHDALLTGYLPTEEHVLLAARLIDRLRACGTAPRIVVDPVLGDAPDGLYLPETVADAVRRTLLPRADILTPNAFELGWLSRRPVATLAQAQAAAAALASVGPQILVTSPPVDAHTTGLLAFGDGAPRLFRTARRAPVPHGTGDVFAGFVAAGLPPGTALGHLQTLIGASLGAAHLRIAEAAALWTAAPPLPADILPTTCETPPLEET